MWFFFFSAYRVCEKILEQNLMVLLMIHLSVLPLFSNDCNYIPHGLPSPLNWMLPSKTANQETKLHLVTYFWKRAWWFSFLRLNLHCLMKSIYRCQLICITEKINYLKKQLNCPNITFFFFWKFLFPLWEKAISHLKKILLEYNWFKMLY